jgi:plasmid stabilization system protein ParE
MPHMHWTEQARDDVDEIYDYIARRDRRPATADRVVRELVSACERYADISSSGSGIGTPRGELGEGTARSCIRGG